MFTYVRTCVSVNEIAHKATLTTDDCALHEIAFFFCIIVVVLVCPCFSRTCSRSLVGYSRQWYIGSIRTGAAGIVFNRVISKTVGKPVQMSDAQLLATLRQGLGDLENFWLSHPAWNRHIAVDGRHEERLFLVGGDEPSIADVLVACELEQLSLLLDEKDAILRPFPRVRLFMKSVVTSLSPQWQSVHDVLSRLESKLRIQRPRL